MPDGGNSPLRAQFEALAETWRELAATRVDMLVVELRHAAHGLVSMLAFAIAGACVLAATWLLANVCALWWAITGGADAGAAMAIALLVNLALVAFIALRVRTLSARLRFDHGRRALHGRGRTP